MSSTENGMLQHIQKILDHLQVNKLWIFIVIVQFFLFYE